MNDERAIRLLEEIRDLQHEQAARHQQALALQEQAIAQHAKAVETQRSAFARLRPILLAGGLLIIVVLLLIIGLLARFWSINFRAR